jgi:FixJ family two-component response regulator
MGGMTKDSRLIAVVDDDLPFLTAIERLLSTRSWITRTFESAQKFLDSLADELPDCLILDVQMPGMNGLELQQTLIKRGVKIPTIILTSDTDAATRERCLFAGAVAYLPKPVHRVDLFAAIDATARADIQ